MLIFRLIDNKEMVTNLKEGNGYPCAGHIKLRVDSVPAENALILSFEANFGSALPIGSKKHRIQHRFNLFAWNERFTWMLAQDSPEQDMWFRIVTPNGYSDD